MSYIVQRHNRFYVVAYDGLDPLTGRERRRWHPVGSDRGEAEALADRLQLDRAGIAPARGGPIRLDDFLRSTWLPHKRRQVRATTAYRYAWFVEHYIAPAIGHVPLRRLRADHLDDLYERLATTGGRHGDGLAPKTVLEVHMIVRAALDLAVQRRLLDHNVAHSAHGRRRRAGTAPARAWSAVELATFLVRSPTVDGSTRRCTSPRTPACDAARSSGSSGPTSTAPPAESRYGGPCRASPGDPSSSTSRLAPADGASTSTLPPSPSSTGGAAGYVSTVSRTVPMTGCSATAGDGSSTLNRSASCSTASCSAPTCPASASTTCATPMPRCDLGLHVVAGAVVAGAGFEPATFGL